MKGYAFVAAAVIAMMVVVLLLLLSGCEEGPGTPGPQEPQESPDTPSPQSKWETSTSTDPLDDSEIVIAEIEADREQLPRGTFIFAARCWGGETDAFIVWGGFLVLGDFPDLYSRSVTVRVGTDAARTETWIVSQGGQATFSPEPIGLLRELVGESRLILHTEIPGIGSVTASFDIDGARAALKPIADACDWSFAAEVATEAP